MFLKCLKGNDVVNISDALRFDWCPPTDPQLAMQLEKDTR